VTDSSLVKGSSSHLRTEYAEEDSEPAATGAEITPGDPSPRSGEHIYLLLLSLENAWGHRRNMLVKTIQRYGPSRAIYETHRVHP